MKTRLKRKQAGLSVRNKKRLWDAAKSLAGTFVTQFADSLANNLSNMMNGQEKAQELNNANKFEDLSPEMQQALLDILNKNNGTQKIESVVQNNADNAGNNQQITEDMKKAVLNEILKGLQQSNQIKTNTSAKKPKLNRIAYRLAKNSSMQREGVAFLAPIISFIVRRFGMQFLKWIGMQILKQIAKAVVKQAVKTAMAKYTGASDDSWFAILVALTGTQKFEDLPDDAKAIFEESLNLFGGETILGDAIINNIPDQYRNKVEDSMTELIDYVKPMAYNKILEIAKPELDTYLAKAQNGEQLNPDEIV